MGAKVQQYSLRGLLSLISTLMFSIPQLKSFIQFCQTWYTLSQLLKSLLASYHWTLATAPSFDHAQSSFFPLPSSYSSFLSHSTSSLSAALGGVLEKLPCCSLLGSLSPLHLRCCFSLYLSCFLSHLWQTFVEIIEYRAKQPGERGDAARGF